MAKLIDGKTVSAAVKERVAGEVSALNKKGITVTLAVILVGNDPASVIYVNNKKKACELTGIISKEYLLSEKVTEKELLALIEKLNNDSEVNGILCQLPLPSSIDENKVISSINPKKDVDAFHPENAGRIMIGKYDFSPCTPAGIMELFDYYGIDVSGKNCVVIGRSDIVGKPMSMLLLHRDATVTICHSKTDNLPEITKNADILISAVGKAKFITADMIKSGAVVIDVGMNRDSGKLCGDVDFESVEPKCSYITPVPGGVGPMTVSTLLQNTLTAAKKQNGVDL